MKNDLKVFSSDVIPVYTMEDTEEKVVIGRELHEKLHISTPYLKWLDRMCEYGFEENVDFSSFGQKSPKLGRPATDHIIKLDMAKHIAMIQRTPEGREIRQKLIDLETAVTTGYAELSPQLQFMIEVERKQKEQERAIAATNARLDGIKDIISLDEGDWRNNAREVLKKIAYEQGGTAYDYRGIWNHSYRLLDTKMGINLEGRLSNRKRTMAETGAPKTRIKNLSCLDIIGEDKKLVVGYMSVIREMALNADVVM